MALELFVNGSAIEVEGDGSTPLLAVLRDELGLTGSKYGCGEGECGACTVLVQGQAVRSCVTHVGDVQGRHILTIEGLEQGGQLHPLQQAFLDNGAFQCGYCTPGMIMSALALLNSCPNPSREEITAAMEGNICRCGTYLRIVRAVEQAALDTQAPAATDEIKKPAEEATVWLQA